MHRQTLIKRCIVAKRQIASWESTPWVGGMRASWEFACRLSEALGEAGEPLYSLNYRFSTKSLIKNFLIEFKVAFHEYLQLQWSTPHAKFLSSSRIAPRCAVDMQNERCIICIICSAPPLLSAMFLKMHCVILWVSLQDTVSTARNPDAFFFVFGSLLFRKFSSIINNPTCVGGSFSLQTCSHLEGIWFWI